MAHAQSRRPARVPVSTYRLQFRPGFGFAEARTLVPYLHDLGITDLYASPILRPRPGSQHGYDVADPTRLNPELGTREEFEALADELASRGMGVLLDIVPNHMAAAAESPRWWDMLERGRWSESAEFFDIDWEAAGGRVVLPILGGTLDEVLGRGEIRPAVGEDGLELRYYERRLPVAPETYGLLLGRHRAAIAEAGEGEGLGRVLELASRLPAGDAADAGAQERMAAVGILKRALREWLRDSATARVLLSALLAGMAGGEHASGLREALDQQHYTLEFWREGLRKINYRRFFDVSDLVSVRSELPQVFDATHATVLDLVRDGAVSGLRVDHIDGLHDPLAYLRRLQESAAAAGQGSEGSPPPYIVVEKILGRGEKIPGEWPVAGTTGYEFAGVLSGVLVDAGGFRILAEHARSRLDVPARFADAMFEAKREIIESLFRAESAALAARLGTLTAKAAPGMDRVELREALVAITAGLPVYRTYIRSGQVGEEDRHRIAAAASEARKHGAPLAAVDFIESILLLSPASVPPDRRGEALAFAQRWQQLTGPVMAKGVEDTALYRHIVLTSLNEVGGEPVLDQDGVEAFHRHNAAAAAERPWTLNPTSTHDTKRSEDVRARISVLSEIAGEWAAGVDRWMGWNAPAREKAKGSPAPRPADEALIYQSLVGAWPLGQVDAAEFAERMQAYMVKAAREAKVRTSWLEAEEGYESALRRFITTILDPSRSARFLADFLPLQRRIALHGAVNSLTQTLLKLVSPGVPDTYQGTELWDLSLVDPDNRRSVDFQTRRTAMEDLRRRAGDSLALVRQLRESWHDGRVKLWVTMAGLAARRMDPAAFLDGDYLPVFARGPRAQNVIALARRSGDRWFLAAGTRLPVSLGVSDSLTPAASAWEGTAIQLPDGAPSSWTDLLTGQRHTIEGGRPLPVGRVLGELPVALLAFRPA